MKLEEYVKNPTKISALSFWKTNNFKTPNNILVLNEFEFSKELLKMYRDKLYFKMIYYYTKNDNFRYNLRNNIEFIDLSVENFVNHINICYE